MFILNDPYRGGLHQQDVTLVAPIHFSGSRVAWTGTCAHQLDIGGMVFRKLGERGDRYPAGVDAPPGIKLVEGGRLRGDLWRMIMGMTRLPAPGRARPEGDDRRQQRRESGGSAS